MNQVPKESIIKLKEYIEKQVIVHYVGGRQITGTLKSFDIQMNMILDECVETLGDENDAYTYNERKTRVLGLVITRGAMVNYIICGEEEIQNPFAE